MKKALVAVAALSTLLLGGCGSKTAATIVILNDEGKEARRIKVDDYSNYSDSVTKYWINGEAHYLKNTSHEVVTKDVGDDE